MLMDLHAHSSGISRCCRVNVNEVIDRARQVGLDGIVLTNHYQKNYVTDGNYSSFAKAYMSEYRYARARGERMGCRVFFGIEVTMERYPKVHMLIYGVDEAFLLRYPTLFDFSQEELYRTVKENGGILIQAHPYRKEDRLLDLQYLDGLEISCHPLYEGTHLEELAQIAAASGKILTCGGDYHADTHRPRCGIHLPNTLWDGQELGKYLASSEQLKLCVQEVDSKDWHEVIYERHRGLIG